MPASDDQGHLDPEKEQVIKALKGNPGRLPQARRLSGGQDELAPPREGGQPRLSSGGPPQLERQRRESIDQEQQLFQGNRRFSVGQEQEHQRRHSLVEKIIRPILPHGHDHEAKDHGQRRGSLSENEPERTISDELAERFLIDREQAGFKSQQTIMRRRRRRNPYANEYERHYIIATADVKEERHKQRRMKEIGMPCSSSETDSSDMSRVSHLSEFTTYDDQVGFKIHHAMLPIIIFANVFGQFPITWRKNKRQGSVTYKFKWSNPVAWIFVLAGMGALACFSISVYNYYKLQTRIPLGSRIFQSRIAVQDRRTQMLIDRNLFALFVVMLNHMAVCIITVAFLSNRRTICNYLNYWSRAMQVIKMDPTWQAWQLSAFGVIFYTVIFVLLLWLHFFKFTTTAVGGPTVTGILLTRSWAPRMLENGTHTSFSRNLQGIQWLGSIIVVYVYMAPKVYILLFLYNQKLLKNCFQKWNGRAYAGSLMNDTKIDKVKGRCTYRFLFRDHCVLVDLLQETSRAFAGIFEAALITDCVGICLFLYLFAKDWKYGKRQQMAVVGNYFVRPYDWVTVFVFLTGSVIMDVVAAVAAAEVGEAAGEGMDIIRRKPMVGRRQDDDLLFALSMYASFNSHHPLEFNGANLFFINKDFIQETASTIFSYFIILLQFMPPLDTDHDSNLTLREEIGTFLRDFERLRDKHWVPVKAELEFEQQDTNANLSARLLQGFATTLIANLTNTTTSSP